MIDKREIKRISYKFGKYLDPIALFLLVAIFILPTLAVLNLSPQSKAVNNVLGAKSQEEITMVLVGGVHDFIKEESVTFPTDQSTSYEALIIKHNDGVYSKPILQISNSFSDSKKLNISGGTLTPTGSIISIIFDENEYVLQDSTGNTYLVSVDIEENAKEDIYLKFESTNPVLFNERITVNIVSR